jgi:hypothetical protein
VNIAQDKIKNAIYKDERFYKIEDWLNNINLKFNRPPKVKLFFLL